MRIKDEIVCFAHLRWCHNGWASNILMSGGCRRSRYPPRLKYWMPVHYDTIEDGQNKQSHLLFSKWNRYRYRAPVFAPRGIGREKKRKIWGHWVRDRILVQHLIGGIGWKCNSCSFFESCSSLIETPCIEFLIKKKKIVPPQNHLK